MIIKYVSFGLSTKAEKLVNFLKSPGVDSWRASTTNRVIVPARQAT